MLVSIRNERLMLPSGQGLLRKFGAARAQFEMVNNDWAVEPHKVILPFPPALSLSIRVHFIIVMIKWTGLAPWEFEFPFHPPPQVLLPGQSLCVTPGACGTNV